MTFKDNWEKTDQQFKITPEIIQAMVALALPEKNLASYEVISGGCANLNIKINMLDEPQSLILRIYVRDKTAAYREQKLAALIKPSVPLPTVYFVGDYEDYRYAITEYMPGMSLRDLLLNHPNASIQDIMHQAGQILASIQKYHFPSAGFFDADLKASHRQGYVTFARECLTHPTVLEHIGQKSIGKITGVLETYGSLFPDENQTHLVHGDYGPENILVDKMGGQWKITAILDWEFAHSGSTLWDVANMLRYAHHMPPFFEDSFLQGLKQGGVTLPENWRTRIYLLNLLSLLDCLIRCSPKECPHQCADICELISFYLGQLSQDQVICRGNEVHRPAGHWTKHVHKLLRHLREQGFFSAPEPLGFDKQGREIVSFIKGETSDTPLSQNAASVKALTSAAKLLRAYHDASQNFLNDDPAPPQDWMLPCKNPQEVICQWFPLSPVASFSALPTSHQD